jgi:tetratricopeptide (TPR) repeat protein
VDLARRSGAWSDGPRAALADLWTDDGRLAEAGRTLRDVLAEARSRPAPVQTCVAPALQSLGRVWAMAGKVERAGKCFRLAVAWERQRLGPGHPRVASALDRLAEFHESRSAWPEAAAVRREAVEALEGIHDGPEHPDVADALLKLAWTTARGGLRSAALSPAVRAAGILDRCLGPEHPRARAARSAVEGLEGGPSTGVRQSTQKRFRAREGLRS